MCEITPEIQELMAEIIKPYGSAEAYISHQQERARKEELEYWGGLNREELKKRYAGAADSTIGRLIPTWDLRRSALSIGDMANRIDPVRIPLYLATREAFLKNSLYGAAEIGMVRGMQAKFLRVLGNWEQGRALTPPLMFMSDGELWKWDGHHRIMIALMTAASVIPFYCADAFSFSGITAVPDAMHLEAVWQAKGEQE